MSTLTATAKRLLTEARQLSTPTNQPVLDRLRQAPGRIMVEAGLMPDAWQTDLLTSPSRRMLLLCSRQAGKSTVAAALATLVALLRGRSLILLLSPTQRQSGELFRKVLDHFNALGRPLPVANESALRIELSNGSRIVALPGVEETVRCFSGVSLLVIDEAARVPDDLYRAVRPMLAVSGGRLICLSTPFGKRGFFYDAWVSGGADWKRVEIPAAKVQRISPEFLAEEQRSLGPRWFAQEYCCSFEEVVGAVFADADIQAALDSDLQPMILSGSKP